MVMDKETKHFEGDRDGKFFRFNHAPVKADDGLTQDQWDSQWCNCGELKADCDCE